MVLEAAMEDARDTGNKVLIEATANQVNQFGGYTRMNPSDFIDFVNSIAKRVGLKSDQLILGGDHLGPLVWKAESEAEAMPKAEVLISQFVAAGFTKIHIDTSMRLGSDDKDKPLATQVIARRAAQLCVAAEAAAGREKPVYVIGSEVPVPGGSEENEDEISVTSIADLDDTLKQFEEAFIEKGLADAFTRVVGVVVQPGVEFADNSIIRYNAAKASELTQHVKGLPNIVLEGHSTDYQTKKSLGEMRRDGIAILKVGPALTFSVRESLFNLEAIEREVYPFSPAGGYSNFKEIIEKKLMSEPKYWINYYHGTEQEKAYARKYSLSDRIRYYLDDSEIRVSMAYLLKNINAVELPYGMLSQFFSDVIETIMNSGQKITAEMLIKERVKNVLKDYR
jgi:D-tagatose-1,6-bisphosphate aldolase subunit GatZ/KbaZ